MAGLDQCMDAVLRLLGEPGATVILDEFQRLPEEHWELLALASQDARGRLLLCGSSLGVAKKVFERKSPLLGLLSAFHVDIASLPDTIASLEPHLGPRDALLWAPLARDPWILAHLEPRGEPWRALASEGWRLAPVASGLVGEVFKEEERMLTRLYDAVLRELALGTWSAKTLAKRLHDAGLLPTPHPSSVTGVLSVLADMGLVSKLRLWRTRGARAYYRHRSPLLSLLLYIDEETGGPPPSPSALKTRYALELQFALGELLAQHKGLRQAYTILPGGEDIDVVLLDRQGQPRIAYEVKLGPLTPGDARTLARRAEKLGIPLVGGVSLTEKPESPLLAEALGPRELLEIARSLATQPPVRPEDNMAA